MEHVSCSCGSGELALLHKGLQAMPPQVQDLSQLTKLIIIGANLGTPLSMKQQRVQKNVKEWQEIVRGWNEDPTAAAARAGGHNNHNTHSHSETNSDTNRQYIKITVS